MTLAVCLLPIEGRGSPFRPVSLCCGVWLAYTLKDVTRGWTPLQAHNSIQMGKVSRPFCKFSSSRKGMYLREWMAYFPQRPGLQSKQRIRATIQIIQATQIYGLNHSIKNNFLCRGWPLTWFRGLKATAFSAEEISNIDFLRQAKRPEILMWPTSVSWFFLPGYIIFCFPF